MTRRTQAAALGIAFVLPLLLAVVVWTLDPFSLISSLTRHNPVGF